MDGSTPIEAEDHAPRCGVCGYPRTGLPAGSPCPECGTLDMAAGPPRAIRALGAARTPAERSWLVSVGLGLALLIVASFFALQSELYLSLGGLTVVAINAPGPKLAGAALILREIGNPGPNGVMGTLAALGQLLAVWLITEPPTLRGNATEPARALRTWTRWTAIVTFGGLFGVLVSGYQLPNAFGWGWWGLPSVVCALVFVELPANVLLYAYLSRLSRRFDPSAEPRGLFGLAAASVLIGLACAGGATVSLFRAAWEDRPVEFWRGVQAAYGVLAMAAGMVMWAGAARLLWHVGVAAAERPSPAAASAFARLVRPVTRWLARVRDEPARLACVAGLLLWLACCRPLLAGAAIVDHRRGLGGDLPTLNFVGPKVWGVPILDRSWNHDGHRLAILFTVVAVWLITAYRPTRATRPWATLARWAATVLTGAAVGVALTIELAKAEVRDSYWTAYAIVGVEAPATLALFLFLGRLAGEIGERRLGRQLVAIGAAAAGVVLSPLAFFALARPLYRLRHSPPVLAAEVVYGALAVAAGVVAWALVVRLTWAVATTTRTRDVN